MVVCPECIGKLKRASGPDRCPFCAAEWDGAGNCPRCFHLHELEGIRSGFEMSGTARGLVHALKYRYYRAVAPTMAALIAGLPAGLDIDRYFAVPLHGSRTRERGFNQSEELLRATDWRPVSRGLERIRKTDRQVGRHLKERTNNLTGAFRYTGSRLDGQTVAVFDDVVTTGTTVLECAKVLKDAGARGVWALSFARASYKPESEEPIED